MSDGELTPAERRDLTRVWSLAAQLARALARLRRHGDRGEARPRILRLPGQRGKGAGDGGG